MADAALATLGVVLALAGIFGVVMIMVVVGGAIVGWAWRRKMGGHQPSPLPLGTVLKPPPSRSAVRSPHNYQPTYEPANPVPPQGGSGATYFGHSLEETMKRMNRTREEAMKFVGVPPGEVGKP